MNDTQVAWWFNRLGSFTAIIDRLNAANDPVYAEGNEQIRAIVNAMLAHGRAGEETQEMTAIDMGEAS